MMLTMLTMLTTLMVLYCNRSHNTTRMHVHAQARARAQYIPFLGQDKGEDGVRPARFCVHLGSSDSPVRSTCSCRHSVAAAVAAAVAASVVAVMVMVVAVMVVAVVVAVADIERDSGQKRAERRRRRRRRMRIGGKENEKVAHGGNNMDCSACQCIAVHLNHTSE